jgi:hypothetical protein
LITGGKFRFIVGELMLVYCVIAIVDLDVVVLLEILFKFVDSWRKFWKSFEIASNLIQFLSFLRMSGSF